MKEATFEIPGALDGGPPFPLAARGGPTIAGDGPAPFSDLRRECLVPRDLLLRTVRFPVICGAGHVTTPEIAELVSAYATDPEIFALFRGGSLIPSCLCGEALAGMCRLPDEAPPTVLRDADLFRIADGTISVFVARLRILE